MVGQALRRLRASLAGRSMGSGEPSLGLARDPETADEQRVARITARLSSCRQSRIVSALADELRAQEPDPLWAAPELGIARLAMYQQRASARVKAMIGDLLVERGAAD